MDREELDLEELERRETPKHPKARSGLLAGEALALLSHIRELEGKLERLTKGALPSEQSLECLKDFQEAMHGMARTKDDRVEADAFLLALEICERLRDARQL